MLDLFTKFQKTFISCEPKEEWLHAGLYIYNGRQIELFHFDMKGLIMDKLAGPKLILCEMPDVSAGVQIVL